MNDHTAEIASGQRFEFGENWRRYLQTLTEAKIVSSENALKKMLGVKHLQGVSFLDIGSGSGLSSLAARRLGATVHSFDYDPKSVACTQHLRDRFFPNDPQWTAEAGSALDPKYIRSLGKFDIVYSWGVLHHTGAMYDALQNASLAVADEGQLFVAIYNTLEYWTPVHKLLKRSYVKAPRLGKWAILGGYISTQVAKGLIKSAVRMRNPIDRYRSGGRGMSVWYDWIDWVGGYPFETATVNEIFTFYNARGYALQNVNAVAGLGCSEFVFRKKPQADQMNSPNNNGAMLAA